VALPSATRKVDSQSTGVKYGTELHGVLYRVIELVVFSGEVIELQIISPITYGNLFMLNDLICRF